MIPALGSHEALEATLVSVLQSRPSDCEIVVVLDRRYDDPYQLSDEVRFAVVAARSTAEALDSATRQCRAPIVHVLAMGAEVDEGWADAAIEHFCDDRIAAVAPLVLRTRREATVCSAGVDYAASGRRRRRGCGVPRESFDLATDVLGPTAVAGFYRRDALLKLPRVFDAAVTDRLYDVDTALQLRTAGYRAVYEPHSVVYREAAESAKVSPFAAGRGAERLFWRNIPSVGRLRSLVAHPLAATLELFDSATVGDKLLRLLGRVTALAEVVSYRRHHRALQAIGTPGLSCVITSTGDRVRIDGAHPHPTTTSKPSVPVERLA